VAADLPDRSDDVLAHLLGDLRKLLVIERLEVPGTVYLVKESFHGHREGTPRRPP
jgi:hypothetical protein